MTRGWPPVYRATTPRKAWNEKRGDNVSATVLLDGHRGAGLLQGLLGLLGRLLVDFLQQRLGRAVDEVLGLLEAKAREGADLLDDLDLLVAGTLEDDVELVLLLGSLSRRARGGGGGGDRD